MQLVELNPQPGVASQNRGYYEDILLPGEVSSRISTIVDCPAYGNRDPKSDGLDYVSNIVTDQDKDEKPGYVNVPAESKESDYAAVSHNT